MFPDSPESVRFSCPVRSSPGGFTPRTAGHRNGFEGRLDMSILSLRDYQHEAIGAVRQAWAEGVRRAAIVLPTGAGKTVVFAHVGAWLPCLYRRSPAAH